MPMIERDPTEEEKAFVRALNQALRHDDNKAFMDNIREANKETKREEQRRRDYREPELIIGNGREY